tara:strand:+ start:25560 stop:26747 length:1188 start_codon:yes stop_codon:yes gene_type:complete
MDLDWLKEVVEGDDLNLLEVKQKTKGVSPDEHLLSKFEEINSFISKNAREPESDFLKPTEHMLYKRLCTIKDSPEQCEKLADYDIHKILPEITSTLPEQEEPKEYDSLEDIFADDSLGLLDDGADSIFNIKNVPKKADMPNKIAQRKKCNNFEDYQHLFQNCHEQLEAGELVQMKFTGEQQIQKGQFFILNGVMCYVADIGERVKKKAKVNAKLHLIFENGTESDMLLRSLATELYKDEIGRRIMPKSENSLDDMLGITAGDQATGYIYILSSLSQNPDIASVQNLYKIGFSTVSVEKRIANAINEPTYLMAPVKIVAVYKSFNMNTHKFETLLHTFFGKACLDIEIVDGDGKTCHPREWFIAPLNCINAAITLLENGEIVNYRYDTVTQDIIER